MEFAGYELPVEYPDRVLKSHLHTRAENSASLFDVGHMGQIKWYGKDRAKFLETVCVADAMGLKEGSASLTLITNTKGGIEDDSIITNHGNYMYMVVNGATKYGDMKIFDAALPGFKAKGNDVSYEYLHTQNLVALQGPVASTILAGLVNKNMKDFVTTMPFMSGKPNVEVAGVPCTVTRCGYTGEDGYEIGMAPEHAEKVTRAILGDKRVLPAGLGARDSLRLEAGLCLYGHDIDSTTTPNEAALIWTVPKVRREGDRANFPGAKIILDELKAKSWKRRRVGLSIQGPPAREGAVIYSRPADGVTDPSKATAIGKVTSGTFSPCLKAAVSMGYVTPANAAEGSKIAIEVRGKLVPAVVSKMPFVPNRYYRGPN